MGEFSMGPYKVLVCGGRQYHDELEVAYALAVARMTARRLGYSGVRVIHGNADGLDRLAARLAAEDGMDVVSYPANWKVHGKIAGPVRNQQMLDNEKPDVVVAFPGGRGTADMVKRAEKADVHIVRAGG